MFNSSFAERRSHEAKGVKSWDERQIPLQLALARGRRWLAMPESGGVKSLRELAAREGIDNNYVSRMVNLKTLAPDILAAILDDALPNDITLFELAVDPAALWEAQWERAQSAPADVSQGHAAVDDIV